MGLQLILVTWAGMIMNHTYVTESSKKGVQMSFQALFFQRVMTHTNITNVNLWSCIWVYWTLVRSYISLKKNSSGLICWKMCQSIHLTKNWEMSVDLIDRLILLGECTHIVKKGTWSASFRMSFFSASSALREVCSSFAHFCTHSSLVGSGIEAFRNEM